MQCSEEACWGWLGRETGAEAVALGEPLPACLLLFSHPPLMPSDSQTWQNLAPRFRNDVVIETVKLKHGADAGQAVAGLLAANARFEQTVSAGRSWAAYHIPGGSRRCLAASALLRAVSTHRTHLLHSPSSPPLPRLSLFTAAGAGGRHGGAVCERGGGGAAAPVRRRRRARQPGCGARVGWGLSGAQGAWLGGLGAPWRPTHPYSAPPGLSSPSALTNSELPRDDPGQSACCPMLTSLLHAPTLLPAASWPRMTCTF